MKNSAQGNISRYGTRSTLTHTPISGTFRISSRTLPTQKLAIRPQNRSACSVMSCGPGCDPLDHQRAQQQRHHRVAGDAEAHRRDEIDLGLGVRRRLRDSPRLRSRRGRSAPASCEILRSKRVGDEGRDRRAGARHRAEQRPDQRAAHHREERLLQLGPARAHVAQAHLGLVADELHPVDAAQEIGDAEQAQRQRHQLDAGRSARESRT